MKHVSQGHIREKKSNINVFSLIRKEEEESRFTLLRDVLK